MTEQRYFFMTMGYPGSGKTYVSQWLSELTGAVHLRGDDMRAALFGADRVENHTPDKTKLVYSACRYAVGQVLLAGYSAVQDANFNRRQERNKLAVMARSYGALPVTVWVQADMNLAKQRVKDRVAAGGYDLLEENLIEKMAARLEPPADDELAITIDGHLSAAEQQAQFVRDLTAITATAVQ